MQSFDLQLKGFDHVKKVWKCWNTWNVRYFKELECSVLIGKSWITTGNKLSEPVNDNFRLSLYLVVQSFRQAFVYFQVFFGVTCLFPCLAKCCRVIIFSRVDVTWNQSQFNSISSRFKRNQQTLRRCPMKRAVTGFHHQVLNFRWNYSINKKSCSTFCHFIRSIKEFLDQFLKIVNLSWFVVDFRVEISKRNFKFQKKQ